MLKLIGLGTCLGFAGLLSSCSGTSNTATTSTLGGSGSGGTTSTSNIGGNGQGGNTAVASTVTPGKGAVAIEDLAREAAIATCNLMSRCLGGYAIEFPGTVSQCVDSLEPTLTDQIVTQIKAAVAAGTVTYDGTAARSCLDAYPQVNCDYSNEDALRAKCTGAWPGKVAITGTCVSNLECADNMISSFCASDGTCPGHCQARSTQGQTCQNDEECRLNLRCDSSNHVCVPQLKLGDTCNDSDATSGLCGGMSACEQDSTSSQTHCSTRYDALSGGEGQICGTTNLCAAGLVCTATGESSDASILGAVYRCQKPVSSGANCRFALGNACSRGQYCPVAYANAATATAQCVPQVAPGGQCNGSYSDECQSRGRCSSGNECIAPQHIGNNCETNGDCFSNVCTNGVCVAPQDCSR